MILDSFFTGVANTSSAPIWWEDGGRAGLYSRENFHGMLENHEEHKSLSQQIFPLLWYKWITTDLVIR